MGDKIDDRSIDATDARTRRFGCSCGSSREFRWADFSCVSFRTSPEVSGISHSERPKVSDSLSDEAASSRAPVDVVVVVVEVSDCRKSMFYRPSNKKERQEREVEEATRENGCGRSRTERAHWNGARQEWGF